MTPNTEDPVTTFPLITGIVGSTAYGLDRPGSDIDRLSVFAAPTLDLVGLDWHPNRDTVTTHDPDHTAHEIGKYARLALKANPTLLELLWLDEYDVLTPHGQMLVDVRSAFLSTGAVTAAYGGYALAQARKLAARGDTFSADTRNRTAKHGMHMRRLMRQGRELLETGEITVRVPDPEAYWAFDSMTPEEMIGVFRAEDADLRDVRSVLPDAPDRATVAEVLRCVRADHVF